MLDSWFATEKQSCNQCQLFINGVNTTVYLLFAWFCHLWGENCLLRFKTYTQCSLCTLLGSFDKICLRAHNYQKWKVRFFICPCHKIYWVEAVFLSLSIILLDLWFLWVGDIWGNFMKNWYFVNNHFMKVQIKKKKTFAHIILAICCTTFCFYLINFQLNTYFPSKFCVFYCKTT